MTTYDEQWQRRIGTIAGSAEQMWGDGLPPGAEAWQTATGDILRLDEAFGAERGLVVLGDGLPLQALAEILAHVPADASVHGLLPPTLRAKISQAGVPAVRETEAGTGQD